MSSFAYPTCHGLLWSLISLLLPIQVSLAQAQVPERYQSIPNDSLSLTSIDVAVFRNRKELEIVPWEIISALGKQELGIDPLLVTSVDITAGMPGLNGPEFGVIFKTTAPVDIAKLSDKLFAELSSSTKLKDMRFRNLRNAPLKVVQSDPHSVIFGSDGTLRRMMATKSKPSKIVDLASSSKYPIRTVSAFEPLRPLIDGAFADASGVPPQLRDDIQVVIDELQYFVSEADTLGAFGKIEMKLVANDSESAKKLADALDRLRTNGLIVAEQALKAALKNESELSGELKTALMQYMQRMKVFLGKANLWQVNGNEIAIQGEFAFTVPTIGVLTGLLLPAVQSAREAARRTQSQQSQNNMKQLMLSLHNHESAYKHFPRRFSTNANGEPLLSWRVAILPFIEQAALYEQFHLDEPWDSEHNLKLLDKMPSTFKHPSFVGPQGNTVYLAPFYESTIWSSKKPRFQEITDGTSNTIALIEVDDGHAVPWTKPDDLDLHELSILDCFRPKGSNSGFFDGSVRFLSGNIDKGVVDALITSAGGEVVRVP